MCTEKIEQEEVKLLSSNIKEDSGHELYWRYSKNKLIQTWQNLV